MILYLSHHFIENVIIKNFLAFSECSKNVRKNLRSLKKFAKVEPKVCEKRAA